MLSFFQTEHVDPNPGGESGSVNSTGYADPPSNFRKQVKQWNVNCSEGPKLLYAKSEMAFNLTYDCFENFTPRSVLSKPRIQNRSAYEST